MARHRGLVFARALFARALTVRARILTIATAVTAVTALSAPAALAGVTPELQRAIRAATFEVVMKKPTQDPLTYEKPLPLELLPYVERTDAYQSIGTAFALGDNTYVTAAHVLTAAVDSQYGPPVLRTSAGQVYPLGKILKYSAHEDFVVFSLAEDPKPPGLPVSRSPHVDDPVLAVGNALGDGIVIRDGLFTSETPEEQDGRWKWIRFSAAASPGNSGGPLLDASGRVIGVVIAKSPNENLNYALPIGSVLDAPPSKARFDQRRLVSLPYLHGSKTAAVKDEFALPLDWPQFVRAYQALLQKHNEAARAELLTAYAASLFPGGGGTEAILYGSEVATREMGVLIQKSDGDWTLETPDFRFTDLPGDGRLGVAGAAGVGLLTLHRGNEASDDAFVRDSKAFMDVALKGLDLRRPVGSDEVRVVSLGPALTDSTETDRYGRKWQVRTWPLPFMDSYVIAELLPTPDGYAGLVQSVPSSVLTEAKIRLSLLANQIDVTYNGTIGQWRAFLSRRELLPSALQDAKLESKPYWTLHTRHFEMGLPPPVMSVDAHSRLLLGMGYQHDGRKVVWDVRSAWWYRDAQEKAYVGLWRQPKPPPTARLELRTQFTDLAERRSPYDGRPVRPAADALEISTAIQAPGTRDGFVSSDVVYGLTVHLDAYPSETDMQVHETQAVRAIHILERGVGEDVTAVPPPAVNSLEGAPETGNDSAQSHDQEYGQDIRGRHFSDDVAQYLGGKLESPWQAGVQALTGYWHLVPSVTHNRDLWAAFLAHNGLPADFAHGATVIAAETALETALSQPPSAEWAQRARALERAYVDERARIARNQRSAASPSYRSRKTACPAPAEATSGRSTPRPAPIKHSLEEFYPPVLRRLGVEGLVVLSVRVDATGCPQAIAVVGSSGSDELDEAALAWVETATFLPAERDGKAVEGTTPLAVDFRLEE